MADGTTLAKAYVQIMPSAQGIGGNIKKVLGGEVDAAGQRAGASAGSKLGGALIGTFGKLLAAAGIGKMISDAISEGGKLEQSIGGIETLFGARGAKSVEEYASIVGKSVGEVRTQYDSLQSSQSTMLQNAQNAYKTAGLSANEYMETATTFGASLLQGLGGDTVKAAAATDTAIQDMADNWNKFGTSQEDVMNAYKGFSKQNYTMLDNLKLGYGGTKTEMERLLADAQKISGVKYDISNLSDVYSAIHVIQEELGVTGTTAKEASTTLQGSASAMKAAFTNLLGNLALGEDVRPSLEALTQTVGQFLKNILGMAGNLLKGLPVVITTALAGFTSGLNFAAENADAIVAQGIEIISQLVNGIVSAAPALLVAAGSVILSFVSALMQTDFVSVASGIITSLKESISGISPGIFADGANVISTIVEAWRMQIINVYTFGSQIISNLVAGISQSLTVALPVGGQIIGQIISGLITSLPTIIESGSNILMSLIGGINTIMPALPTTAGEIINSLVGTWMDNLPQLLMSGAKLIIELVAGIMSVNRNVAEAGGTIILNLVKTFLSHLPDMLASGISLIGDLIAGMIRSIPQVVNAAKNLVKNMIDTVKNTDWISLGRSIIDGIIKGIKDAAGKLLKALKDAVKKAFDAAKETFGSSSSSSAVSVSSIGEAIPAGIATGIRQNAGVLTSAMDELAAEASGQANTQMFANISAQSDRRAERESGIKDLERALESVERTLKEYLPQLTDRKVVLDSGAIVGELAAPMDKALGEISALRGRL